MANQDLACAFAISLTRSHSRDLQITPLRSGSPHRVWERALPWEIATASALSEKSPNNPLRLCGLVPAKRCVPKQTASRKLAIGCCRMVAGGATRTCLSAIGARNRTMPTRWCSFVKPLGTSDEQHANSSGNDFEERRGTYPFGHAPRHQQVIGIKWCPEKDSNLHALQR